MSKRDIFQAINLGKELENTVNETFNLWTWLPSAKITQKHHGDYYSEHTPSPADVMTEASMYINKLVNRPDAPLTAEEKDWFERCCCGEIHDQ